jgi:hypothetical protein
MEELLGGRNEKTMQTALKAELQCQDLKCQVVESVITLEVCNASKRVTFRRAVKSANRDARLVEIIDGPALSSPSEVYNSHFAYLHDPGAAIDPEFGFHAYLEQFLGFVLPQVEHYSGTETRLYLQAIFPAFFIEQKGGWTDFLATIPRYGIRNVKARVIEFILDMDVIENSKKKQAIAQAKAELSGRWKSSYEAAVRTARTCGGQVTGIPSKPTTFVNAEEIRIILFKNGKEISLGEYVSALQDAVREIESKPIPSVGASIEKSQTELNNTLEELARLSLQYDRLIAELSDATSKLDSLNSQLQRIESDLRKNKSTKKIHSYGAQLGLSVTKEVCPTCSQPMKDYLFPQDFDQEPLSLDQNINLLEEQRKMIIAYIAGQKKAINIQQRRYNSVHEEISNRQERARALRKELASDDRQPSEAEIERKVTVKHQISDIANTDELLTDQAMEFVRLAQQWRQLLEDEARLPKEFFSVTDIEKMDNLENDLKVLLLKFGYKSKSLDYVTLSKDTYLPSVEPLNARSGTRDYDIRFDSSASDFIRTIWAFTCSMYRVSHTKNCNHPGILVFDEPAQHSMANSSLSAFLEELQMYRDAQVIVAASFNNSDADFNEATQSRNFSMYYIQTSLLQKA